VLALDVGKGVVAVLATRALLSGLGPQVAEWGAAAAAAAAVLGHIYSPFIGFRGGRGVATTAGGLLGLAPASLLVVAPATLLIMWRSRYVSLGSLAGAVLTVVVVGALLLLRRADGADLAFALVAASLVVVAHRDNIARLRAGTERRLGEPAAARDG
ncbi:MAG: glycerol-3-phosphate acyltransferase, partial [Candidatus Limnocylindria bacterium]